MKAEMEVTPFETAGCTTGQVGSREERWRNLPPSAEAASGGAPFPAEGG
jgi:hypothetical protein